LKRLATVLISILSLGPAGVAATFQTTLRMPSGQLTASSDPSNPNSFDISIVGGVTMTNLGPEEATIAGTLVVFTTPLPPRASPYVILLCTIQFTLADSITGTCQIPSWFVDGYSFISGGQFTITGGTGTYAGASGTISLSGTSSGPIFLSSPPATIAITGSGNITLTGSSGAGPAPTAPIVSAVEDAGGYTSPVAPGSIFVVKGTNLAGSRLVQFGFPLPGTTSDGVSITFTPITGGSGVSAYLVYTIAQQLAAVLPSTLAPGTYYVTVTYNRQTSPPFPATVVKLKPGLFTQDATGSGLVLGQNYISPKQYDLNRLTTGVVNGYTISPAKPGQTVILYATGLGAVPGGDNTASTGYDYGVDGTAVEVIVGGSNGTTIPASYAGAVAGFAGLDQVNFTLPANVLTGCAVTLQISVSGILSNAVTLSVAPSASASACSFPPLTKSQLEDLDNGGTYTSGILELKAATNVKLPGISGNTVSASFTQVTGFQIPTSVVTGSYSTIGNCQLATTAQVVAAPTNSTSLDAGMITLTGPDGSGISNLPLPDGWDFSYFGDLSKYNLVAGSYTLNGGGGKDVGKFSASVTLGPPVTLNSDFPSTVTRSNPLTLTWTGGNPTDTVQIGGEVATTDGPVPVFHQFACLTTAISGSFTVPAAVLSQLPPPSHYTGAEQLTVTVGPAPLAFSVPLTAGGTAIGTFSASAVIFGNVEYQ
jgi:uncharacterized protein (TIGR03437 family)